MSELQTIHIQGACGDELFHKDPNNPEGPIFIICTAHPEDEGEVVDTESISAELTESIEPSSEPHPCQDQLKMLGGYTVGYCGTCTMNPNARETGHFNNIGGSS